MNTQTSHLHFKKKKHWLYFDMAAKLINKYFEAEKV